MHLTCLRWLLSIAMPSAILFISTALYAQEDPNQCIKLDTTSGAGVLSNTCEQTINVTYCVENPKIALNCAVKGYGVKTLAKDEMEIIPSYLEQGGGMVYWGACEAPAFATDWVPDQDYYCNQ